MRKTERVTVGKVTYLHPSFAHTPEELLPVELFLGHPPCEAFARPKPPAPSVSAMPAVARADFSIGEDLDVELHYGQPATPHGGFDEADLWSDPQEPAKSQPITSTRHSLLPAFVVGLIMLVIVALSLAAWLLLIQIASFIGLPEFLQTLIPTLK